MQKSGEDYAVILVKAAPQVGRKHGELVCCAGVRYDPGKPTAPEWLRLYPISFRVLDEAQKFTRWDIVHFRWRLPTRDKRPESRHVEHETLRIVGKLKSVPAKQQAVAKLIVRSLKKEKEKGKSFALLRPEIEEFMWIKKTQRTARNRKKNIRASQSTARLVFKRNLANIQTLSI